MPKLESGDNFEAELGFDYVTTEESQEVAKLGF
jgi:hypothetical protein